MKLHRLALALKSIGGDAEAILATKRAAEVPHRHANVRRLPDRKDGHPILEKAIHAAGAFHGGFVFDVKAFLHLPGLRFIDDGLIEHAIRRIQVAPQQVGGGVQRLGIVVETIRRGVRWQQISQIDLHAQQIAHGVRILGTIQPSHHHAAFLFAMLRLRFRRALTNPLHCGLQLSLGRAWFVFGWHVAGLQLIEHREPVTTGFFVTEIHRETLQIELALRFRA